MRSRNLFDNYKYCSICQRRIPQSCQDTVCPNCTESALFQDVKDYIRANDVNEYMVAQHFNISLKQVRKWIRDGRIQYKELSNGTVTMHCQVCGAQISFGSICQACLKEQNVSGGLALQRNTDAGDMRHLQISKKKKKKEK